MVVRMVVALVIITLSVAASVFVNWPGSFWSLAALARGGLVTIAVYLPRNVAVAILMALAVVALIFVTWPGTMYGTAYPWDYAGALIAMAMDYARRPRVTVAIAGLTAAAILVATVWLSRRVASDRPD
jgi:hypothetical protein